MNDVHRANKKLYKSMSKISIALGLALGALEGYLNDIPGDKANDAKFMNLENLISAIRVLYDKALYDFHDAMEQKNV